LDGLLVTPTGITLAGHPVPLERSLLAQRLLHELAQRPGEFVPRRTLWRLLYADDHTRDGRVARGVNPDDLDDRLRAEPRGGDRARGRHRDGAEDLAVDAGNGWM
jgi:hypothetical protein